MILLIKELFNRCRMKKSVSLITLLLGFIAVTHADLPVETPQHNVEAQKENLIGVYTRPEILGLWGMDIPQNKKCVEYYNFRNGNEVVVNSAQEWSIGQFDYQPSPDNTLTKLPTLMIQVNYENNATDCSGNTVDQAGELSQYFVKWNSPTQINFCATEQGKDCFATLKRVLP